MQPTTTEYLTTAEVAETTGRSVATVNRMVRRGELTPVIEGPGKTGARWFRREDIDALVAS